MANSYCANCGAANEGVAFCATCGAPTGAQATAGGGASALQSGHLGFVDAIKYFFKNYANFNGRATRSAYWYAYLGVTIAGNILGAIGSGYSDIGSYQQGPLGYIVSIGCFVPGLAIATRRLHDTGRSGKALLWVLLPVIGWIMLIVWLASAGEPRDNQYGPRA